MSEDLPDPFGPPKRSMPNARKYWKAWYREYRVIARETGLMLRDAMSIGRGAIWVDGNGKIHRLTYEDMYEL